MFLLSLYDHRCWRFVAYLLRQFVRMFVTALYLVKPGLGVEPIQQHPLAGGERLSTRYCKKIAYGIERRASFRAFLLELLCQARHKRGCRKNEDRFCLWR